MSGPRRDPAREYAERYCFNVETGTRAFRRYARREVEEAVKASEIPYGKNCSYVSGWLNALDAVRGHAAIRARGGRDKR